MSEYKELFECIMALLKSGNVLVGVEDIDPYSCEDKICMRNPRKIAYMDFTLHDKPFENKIAELEENVGYYKDSLLRVDKNCDKLHNENKELKQRIFELESKETVDLPFDPLERANYLINATYERETSTLERGIKGLPDKVNSDRYTIDELEQIAEHLLIYCKHNKECEE